MLLRIGFAILSFFTIGVGSAWSQQELTKKKELSVVIIEEITTAQQSVEQQHVINVPVGNFQRTEVKFDTKTLSAKFKEFMDNLGDVFRNAPSALGGFSLSEIELNLEMNAEGGFHLIGKATVGATTGIKVVLKKQS
ncbi:MAG: hypothetical protein ACE5KZ_13300 [Candidatus Scalinduaceae bacterium]